VRTKDLGASPKGQADYTAVRILVGLCVAEIAILYLLIAVESPVTPVVHRLLQTPSGIVVLIASVVGFLLLSMIAVLLLRRRSTPPSYDDGQNLR
jgi:membrane protein implicated in regulation of membrane protease activity